jgi:hypothetical protein
MPKHTQIERNYKVFLRTTFQCIFVYLPAFNCLWQRRLRGQQPKGELQESLRARQSDQRLRARASSGPESAR